MYVAKRVPGASCMCAVWLVYNGLSKFMWIVLTPGVCFCILHFLFSEHSHHFSVVSFVDVRFLFVSTQAPNPKSYHSLRRSWKILCTLHAPPVKRVYTVQLTSTTTNITLPWAGGSVGILLRVITIRRAYFIFGWLIFLLMFISLHLIILVIYMLSAAGLFAWPKLVRSHCENAERDSESVGECRVKEKNRENGPYL